MSLVPFNPTFQFAFSDARQYWEIADLCYCRMKYNLPESLDIRVLMRMRKSLLNPSDKPNLLHKNKCSLVSYKCRLSFAQWDSDVAHHSWPSALLPMRQSVKMSQRACVNLWQSWRAWVTASGGCGAGGWHSGFWLDVSSMAAPSSFMPKHLVSTLSKWIYLGGGLLIGWVDRSGREKVSHISISHWQEFCCKDNCGFVAGVLN